MLADMSFFDFSCVEVAFVHGWCCVSSMERDFRSGINSPLKLSIGAIESVDDFRISISGKIIRRANIYSSPGIICRQKDLLGTGVQDFGISWRQQMGYLPWYKKKILLCIISKKETFSAIEIKHKATDLSGTGVPDDPSLCDDEK